MKIKANFDHEKVQYYLMVKVLKTRFSNINHFKSFGLKLYFKIIIL